MHKSGNIWKWPRQEDKIFYKHENILKKINPPVVAGTRGQFHLMNLILVIRSHSMKKPYEYNFSVI